MSETAYVCPAREGSPDNPPCGSALQVFGKRHYTVHPVTGALQKDDQQLYDIVCERAHVLIEDATDVGSAIRDVLDIDRSPKWAYSATFASLLTGLVRAGMRHDTVGCEEARQQIYAFMRSGGQ